jgi:4-amino-4-deoxy-L-arabinose transferase-like glycosyltransferase
MSQITLVLPLVLFILSETFLKRYLQLQPWYGAWITTLALLTLAGSAFFLFLRMRREKIAKDVWDATLVESPEQRWHKPAVAAIIVAGCFFRLWQLGSLAEGMTYDEAYKGLDGIAIREFHERPVFLEWNGGREALVAYLVAVNQKLFDGSIVSVRLITPLTGCLTLLFFYLLVKTIFNRNLALLSTFLMAVSKYHIIHSRYGVRAGQFTLYEVAALYFLALGLKSERKFSWPLIAGGVVAGLGFYTYIAYRIFPLILLAFVVQKEWLVRLRKHVLSASVAAVLCAAIVAPEAVYYIQNRQSFTERMQKTQVWSQKGKYENEPAIKLVALASAATLGMFTYQGDSIARHNVGIEPMLSRFAAPFFLLGILLALMNFRRPHVFFFLAYFLLSLLPGMLSVGAPNAARDLGVIPAAMVFTALGLLAAIKLLPRSLARAFTMIVLAGCLLTGVKDALFRFPAILDSLPPYTAELWGMDRDPAQVAALLNGMGPGCAAYLSPQFYFHSTVEYLTYSKSRHRLLTFRTDFGDQQGKVAVLVLQPRRMNLWWLRDGPGKHFFKWWEQVYGSNSQDIRALLRQTYDPYMTKSTDRKLLATWRAAYPRSRLVTFPTFTLLLFKPEPAVTPAR